MRLAPWLALSLTACFPTLNLEDRPCQDQRDCKNDVDRHFFGGGSDPYRLYMLSEIS